MKKYVPLLALCGALVALSIGPRVQAEDPKPDEDSWNNEQFGVKLAKPKGNAQWKFVGEGGWDKFFKETDGVVFFLAKWQSDNTSGDLSKGQPLVEMYGYRYDTMGKFKIGDWEGSPTSTKGFAKALFEEITTRDYKNCKNTKETGATTYPCGKMYEFSTYGEHKKYGGSHYLRILICKKDSKHTFQFVVHCAPGEEKKAGVEIETVMRTIKFYDTK